MKLNLPDRPADWSDCHGGAVAPPDGPAHAVFRRGLKGAPRWMGAAMVLRNMVVRPFGLVGVLRAVAVRVLAGARIFWTGWW